jgi:hypothetical protein
MFRVINVMDQYLLRHFFVGGVWMEEVLLLLVAPGWGFFPQTASMIAWFRCLEASDGVLPRMNIVRIRPDTSLQHKDGGNLRT